MQRAVRSDHSSPCAIVSPGEDAFPRCEVELHAYVVRECGPSPPHLVTVAFLLATEGVLVDLAPLRLERDELSEHRGMGLRVL